MKRKQKVLIVEDELILAMVIEKMIVQLGHTVVGKAVNGEMAIRAFDQYAPDLILMDIRLQGEMDGIDTINRIRRSNDVPVVFITGNSDEEFKSRADETGYLAFLKKPVTYYELSKILK